MARVKRAKNSRKNHKKVLKLAKGYYGGKSKLFKTANESVIRALRNSYVGRKNKKRDYRSLWIARINAATRINNLSCILELTVFYKLSLCSFSRCILNTCCD